MHLYPGKVKILSAHLRVVLPHCLTTSLPQYLCDGAPDCHDGYDEDAKLCTAARRPPVEETSSFIYSLLLTHG